MLFLAICLNYDPSSQRREEGHCEKCILCNIGKCIFPKFHPSFYPMFFSSFCQKKMKVSVLHL